jgi:hypothetical protein
VLSNTHPLLYMLVAVLNKNFMLMANFYEGKVHLHNDLNWFKLYELVRDGVDINSVKIPQIVVFLADTVDELVEFYIIPSMYKQEKWYPIVEVSIVAYTE